MDTSESSQVQSHLLRERVAVLQSLLLIQQRIVLIALLVASVVAPLTAIIEQPDADDPVTDAMGIFGSLGYFFQNDPESFGDREIYPLALDAGLTLTRIGLVLLLVAIFCALVTVVNVWARHGRGPRLTLIVLGIVMIIAAAITYFGLSVLPDGDDATNATPWLLVPVAASAAAFYHLWSLSKLE
ncbi:hypothetical protein [Agreia pratensis]|uniref:Uncharacterized protein n=1 Tax=Agreia pratensis TaxID=150121 RepID=A0A1X7JJE7_9MICO|nr:hypothetical protein [Agreia pratensis]SMG27421.1 hypothetical protein SAMN06296010_1419 [Agreia pratensis]